MKQVVLVMSERAGKLLLKTLETFVQEFDTEEPGDLGLLAALQIEIQSQLKEDKPKKSRRKKK